MTQEQIQKQAEDFAVKHCRGCNDTGHEHHECHQIEVAFLSGANYILSSTESVAKDFLEFISANVEIVREEKITLYRYHDNLDGWGNYTLDDICTLYKEKYLDSSLISGRQSGQAGCAVWVDCNDRKPEEGKEVFFDGGEHGCLFGKYVRTGNVDYVVYKDMDGDDHYEKYEMYERWLDESLTQSEQGKEAAITDRNGEEICDGQRLIYYTKGGGMSDMQVYRFNGELVGAGLFVLRTLRDYASALDFEGFEIVKE